MKKQSNWIWMIFIPALLSGCGQGQQSESESGSESALAAYRSAATGRHVGTTGMQAGRQ